MFGSQALETAIGLVTMFFIVATAASAITEVYARLLKKRAKDLEKGIGALLRGQELNDAELKAALTAITTTSVWKAASSAAGKSMLRKGEEKKKGPSYLSAKMFADAVTEFLAANPRGENNLDRRQGAESAAWPENLTKRLDAMVAEGRSDLLSLKSGLESWFDEAMDRLEGAYRRWATTILFLVGLFLAALLNLSTTSTAADLWHDPVTRQAVADSADKLLKDGAQPSELETVAATTDKLTEVGIPGGWDADARGVWTSGWFTGPQLSAVFGWLLTAILVMLGGPFWFDLLGRLVALRSAGSKPPTAAADQASATAELAANGGKQPQVVLAGPGLAEGFLGREAEQPEHDQSKGGARAALQVGTFRPPPARGRAHDDFARRIGLISPDPQ